GSGAMGGNPADGGEGGPVEERCLVAGRDAGGARAQVHRGGDHGEQRMASLDAHVEAAPWTTAGRQTFQHQPVGARRQAGVGVEKQEKVAARPPGAGIHLRGAAARGRGQPVRHGAGGGHGAGAAAAVDHDDLGAAPAQSGQVLQGRRDAGRFIQDRHDDREVAGAHRAFAVSTATSSSPSRPTPGIFSAGRRMSRPATRPRTLTSTPSTQPSFAPSRPYRLSSTPVWLPGRPASEPSARKSRPTASDGIAMSSAGAARSSVAVNVLLLGPGHTRYEPYVAYGYALTAASIFGIALAARAPRTSATTCGRSLGK